MPYFFIREVYHHQGKEFKIVELFEKVMLAKYPSINHFSVTLNAVSFFCKPDMQL